MAEEKLIHAFEEGIKEVGEVVSESIGDIAKRVEEAGEEVIGGVAEKISAKKEGKKTKSVAKKSGKKKETGEKAIDNKSEEEVEKTEYKEGAKKEQKKEIKVENNLGDCKVFGLYDISEVKINDAGLKNVINLDYRLMVKSHGRIREKFGKAHVNIIERLANTIAVPGHRGKKHKIITGWATGKYNKNMKMALESFKIIYEKTNNNPIQVLIRAIENGAPRDEVTMIQYGGARYPQAVDTAPLRRISLALRNIVHGAYDKSFRSKKKFSAALAEEIMVTAEGGNSIAVTKKNELEKQADAAR